MYNTDLPTRAELPSARQLLRSTVVAAFVAGGLLITTILPAEYGIDPTGAGRALGLTAMGEIKSALAREAQAGEMGAAAGPVLASSVVAASPGGTPQAAAPAAASDPAVPPPAALPTREHTVSIELKPGEAAEIKLTMQKNASVRYAWSTDGAGINYDTHGDPVDAPKGFYHGYGKGRNETAQAGTLQAAFDGKHGWFWRNRSAGVVRVTLKTSGAYGQIERVL